MPNKYGIVNGRGNYDPLSKRRVFKLPCLDPESQKWLAVIPPRKDLHIANAKSFFVCEKHWPKIFQGRNCEAEQQDQLLHQAFLMYLLHVYRSPNLLLAQQNKETNNLRFSWPETGSNRLVTL